MSIQLINENCLWWRQYVASANAPHSEPHVTASAADAKQKVIQPTVDPVDPFGVVPVAPVIQKPLAQWVQTGARIVQPQPLLL